MTARGWTPEPWAAHFHHVLGADRSVAVAMGRFETRERRHADAARIVACVNGCASLPDPERDVADLIALVREIAAPPWSPTVIDAARSLLARLEGGP